MHKLPYCCLRYNDILYQAVFDFLHNNKVPFKKDKLAFQSCCLLFIYCTIDFLNQTLTLCINIIELGYSCNVWIKSIVNITTWK